MEQNNHNCGFTNDEFEHFAQSQLVSIMIIMLLVLDNSKVFKRTKNVKILA